MKEKTTIAVIIPVYNVEPYLERCVDSVLAQSVLPEEIILVDDGSKDGSGTLCDALYQKDPEHIRVIHQENGGLSAARNSGIEICRSDYIMLLDSDDTIKEHACRDFLQAINGRAFDIVVANITTVRPNRLKHKQHTLHGGEILSGPQFMKSELLAGTMFYESVHCLYAREFLNKIGLRFYPRLLHEDQLFVAEAFLKAEKVLATNIDFYDHMMRDESICTQKDQTPNARAIVKICNLEEALTGDCADPELKRLMMDHCVDLYYKTYIDADLIHHKEIRLTKEYLKKHSSSGKNRLRTMLYLISEAMFVRVEKTRRKIK
ncbi:glycosyltransferase [Ruminococcus sp.]|uniref:glycosyltransferase n=1 Tax=Ruminococcus sp. TaxID=41978 RepID=UPI00386A5BA2